MTEGLGVWKPRILDDVICEHSLSIYYKYILYIIVDNSTYYSRFKTNYHISLLLENKGIHLLPKLDFEN